MKITALIHDCAQDGEAGFAVRCAEFPEANGQGETIPEAMEDLHSAIAAVLDYRRSEAKESLAAPDHFLESAI